MSFAIVKSESFAKFPPDAKIKLRLMENKFVETLNLGTVSRRKDFIDLEYTGFHRPSCQLRVVAPGPDRKGQILGSTKTWRMTCDADDTFVVSSDSLLHYHTKDLGNQVWELEVGENYPILYIDEQIPNARSWTRDDPVFHSCVLPSVIRQVFQKIFSEGLSDGPEWARDWVAWAYNIGAGTNFPTSGDTEGFERWMNNLLILFSNKHRLKDRLVRMLSKEVSVS